MGTVENDHLSNELRRLRKLRKLVASEIHSTEYLDCPVEMTLIELEEWFQEIDAEILKLAASNRKGDCMKMEIDIDIIKETIHCRKDFDCLKNGNCILKKVDNFVSGNVLFVNCADNGCDYHMSYDNSTICRCPTRQAIYKKYAK